MAIWQYSFVIVPEQELKSIGCDDVITKNLFLSHFFWPDRVDGNIFDTDLKKILPHTKSWSADINLFGKEESHNVEIFLKEGLIEEIGFRFDFRDRSSHILSELIEFCIHKGLRLIAEDFTIPKLNAEIIIRKIESSEQHRQFEELRKLQ